MNTIIFNHLVIEPDYMMISKGGCSYVNLVKISDGFIDTFFKLKRNGVKTKLYKAMLKDADSISVEAIEEYEQYLVLYSDAYNLVRQIKQGIEKERLDIILSEYQHVKGKINILLSYNSSLGKFRKLINNLT